MGEALGKTHVSSSVPTVNEHNQTPSQTIRKTIYFSSQAGGKSNSMSTFGELKLQSRCPLNQGGHFPLLYGTGNIQYAYGIKGVIRS